MVSDYLSNARDVVVILTGVAGLLFGLYKYRKGAKRNRILQIELFFEAPAVAFSTVVSVGVQIKNVGMGPPRRAGGKAKGSDFLGTKDLMPRP